MPLGGHIETVDESLPKYAEPPVVEVAISVQFDELTGFQPIHFGLLWEQLRDRYPKTEYHPPLATIVELVGTAKSQTVSLDVDSGFPVGRCWYLSDDGLRLIQVQPDRFILNWRKLDSGITYPSYDHLRQEFRSELEQFLSFLRNNNLGPCELRQCEVTYVNHLLSGIGWTDKRDLPSVISLWSGETTEGQLPPPEDIQLSCTYRVEADGKSLGRLHVTLQSAIRNTDKLPLFVLQMVGRGPSRAAGVEGALATTDRLHKWIVRGFTDITTKKMHNAWGRLR